MAFEGNSKGPQLSPKPRPLSALKLASISSVNLLSLREASRLAR